MDLAQAKGPTLAAIRIAAALVILGCIVVNLVGRLPGRNLVLGAMAMAAIQVSNAFLVALSDSGFDYASGFVMTTTILAALPLTRRMAYSILAASFLIFFGAGFAFGMPFSSPEVARATQLVVVDFVLTASLIQLLSTTFLVGWRNGRTASIGEVKFTIPAPCRGKVRLWFVYHAQNYVLTARTSGNSLSVDAR